MYHLVARFQLARVLSLAQAQERQVAQEMSGAVEARDVVREEEDLTFGHAFVIILSGVIM